MKYKVKGTKTTFTSKQLKVGTAIEAKEHKDITKGDMSVAEKIARAHLKENPEYYTYLSEMEKEMEEDKKESDENAMDKEEEGE